MTLPAVKEDFALLNGVLSPTGLRLTDPNLPYEEVNTLPPEVDRAWAAGFFDGEGWMGVGRKGRHHFLKTDIAQAKDYASVHRFHNIMGVGRLYGPYERKDGSHPILHCVAHGAEALHTLGVMLPYLGGVKTAQALKAIDFWIARKIEAKAVTAAWRKKRWG